MKAESNGDVTQFATRAMVASNFPVKPDYKQILSRDFDAEVDCVDFKDQLGVVNEVNKWVGDHTNQKITQLLSDPLPSNTQLLLLNAIYFRGLWETSFKKRTYEAGQVRKRARPAQLECALHARFDKLRLVRRPEDWL